MKKIYTLLTFFFVLNCTLFATQDPGFIITKDAKIITGQIADIFYSDWKTELIFINEMGRSYNFSPNLIKGFAFNTGKEVLQFESKLHDGTWRFLKILEKGKTISLYQSPSTKLQKLTESEGKQHFVSKKVNELWLEINGGKPFRIYSIGYKKQLKKYLVSQPTLIAKLGQKGYKFKNLQDIIREYNELIAKKAKEI